MQCSLVQWEQLTMVILVSISLLVALISSCAANVLAGQPSAGSSFPSDGAWQGRSLLQNPGGAVPGVWDAYSKSWNSFYVGRDILEIGVAARAGECASMCHELKEALEPCWFWAFCPKSASGRPCRVPSFEGLDVEDYPGGTCILSTDNADTQLAYVMMEGGAVEWAGGVLKQLNTSKPFEFGAMPSEEEGFEGLGVTFAPNTFYLGPQEMVEEAAEALLPSTPSAALCAKACSQDEQCQLWAWCGAESDGCTVLGFLDSQNITDADAVAPGSCLLSHSGGKKRSSVLVMVGEAVQWSGGYKVKGTAGVAASPSPSPARPPSPSPTLIRPPPRQIGGRPVLPDIPGRQTPTVQPVVPVPPAQPAQPIQLPPEAPQLPPSPSPQQPSLPPTSPPPGGGLPPFNPEEGSQAPASPEGPVPGLGSSPQPGGRCNILQTTLLVQPGTVDIVANNLGIVNGLSSAGECCQACLEKGACTAIYYCYTSAFNCNAWLTQTGVLDAPTSRNIISGDCILLNEPKMDVGEIFSQGTTTPWASGYRY